MKCELCNSQIEEMYLKKIRGTYIKDKKGKKHSVCSACQEKFNNDKDAILKEL